MTPTLLWFRQDLRLQDNPALHAALARGGPIVPVYILDDGGEGAWPAGGATRWWLHQSLAALDADLRTRGARLVLARGESGRVLADLARATGAGAVHWNRRYEPAAIARDSAIKTDLGAIGLEVKSFNGALLNEPHTIANKAGRPFQVFTPYWRHCLTLPVAEPLKLPEGPWPAPAKWPASAALDALGLRPTIPWDAEFSTTWTPGEAGAKARLGQFVARVMTDYSD